MKKAVLFLIILLFAPDVTAGTENYQHLKANPSV